MTSAEFAKFIDHTLLKPDSTRDDCRQFCEAAAPHGFASVCILPAWVSIAKEVLVGTGIAVCTVIGFPHGNAPAQAKALEVTTAIADGASEVDMVINISAMKSTSDLIVRRDIEAVVETARYNRAISKVIIECAYLTEEEKRRAIKMALDSGADFVKTSTGFATPPAGVAVGATVEDIRLMKSIVGDGCGIKAAGGIRNVEDALTMIEAGATRLGTSAGVALVQAFAAGATKAGTGASY